MGNPGDLRRRVQILRTQAARSDKKIREIKAAAKEADKHANEALEALASIPRR